MENKMQQYDMIKFITTFLVVIAHATRMYTGEGVVVPATMSSVLAYITDLIYSFHMPLFITVFGMVYGMCIEELNKYDDAKGFVINKLTRLMIPYYAFGLFVVAPVMVIFRFTEQSYFEYSIFGILFAKNPRHLWYIFVLFMIFLLCGFLKKGLKKWNPVIVMIIALIVCFGSQFLTGWFQLSALFYYIFFFGCGFYMNRYYGKISMITKHPAIIVVTATLVAVLCQYDIGRIKMPVAILGIICMTGLVQYIPKEIFDSKLYVKLKKNLFGVYLFHPMIIYVLFYFWGQLNISPFVLCTLIIIIAYVLSHVLTSVLRSAKLGIFLGEKL